MAVTMMLIGIFAGLVLAATTWLLSTSLLLALVAYPLGGAVGCLLAGAGLYLCGARAEAESR
jgi:hypothetical protein